MKKILIIIAIAMFATAGSIGAYMLLERATFNAPTFSVARGLEIENEKHYDVVEDFVLFPTTWQEIENDGEGHYHTQLTITSSEKYNRLDIEAVGVGDYQIVIVHPRNVSDIETSLTIGIPERLRLDNDLDDVPLVIDVYIWVEGFDNSLGDIELIIDGLYE